MVYSFRFPKSRARYITAQSYVLNKIPLIDKENTTKKKLQSNFLFNKFVRCRTFWQVCSEIYWPLVDTKISGLMQSDKFHNINDSKILKWTRFHQNAPLCYAGSRVMPTLHKSPRAGESVKVYFHSVGRCQPSILKVNPFLTQNALFY